LNAGSLVNGKAGTDFLINITNTGALGDDSYQVAVSSSAWPASLYQADGSTPFIDSGPLPQGATASFIARFNTPAAAMTGDTNIASLAISSTIDPGKSRAVILNMAVPAVFAQVFEDYSNAAMSFMLSDPTGISVAKETPDFYYANGPALGALPDGGYVFAWRKPEGNAADAVSDIEYTLLNRDGSIRLPTSKLTSNLGNGGVYDYSPAVAVTADGSMGLTWYRWTVDSLNNVYNYNIYFASLSASGTVLAGPINVTNNNQWDSFNDINSPHFFSPAIAAHSDNNFVLSWQDYRTDGAQVFSNDIWIAARGINGASLLSPRAFTNDGGSISPILNPLTGNRSILTWMSVDNPFYTILNSNGSTFREATLLDSTTPPGGPPDAVALPNGNTAVAWPIRNGVGLVFLDANYAFSSGPTYAFNPPGQATDNRYLSITHDPANHVIMTWTTASQPIRNLYYALAENTGAFLTNPIWSSSSESGLITSINGQGNAPYTLSEQIKIDIKPGDTRNRIKIEAGDDGLIDVAILSDGQFNAPGNINPASVTFGHFGTEDSINRTGRRRTPDCRIKDINRDGLSDLVCRFWAARTGFQAGDSFGILKARTVNGLPTEGRDTVVIKFEQ